MRIKLVGLVFLGIALLFGLGACKSTKSYEKAAKATVIDLPLSSKEYRTDRDYFRAVQSGKSPDLATSKKIALHNAKSELAGNIQSTLKRVTEQFTNQRSIINGQEYANEFNELAREEVNRQLNVVKIIGDKLMREKDGSYIYFIAIEMSKENLLNQISDKVSKDAKLQLEFDKQQFKKIFDEEMKKLEEDRKSVV